MTRNIFRFLLCTLIFAIALQGCAFDFTGDNFQRLKLFFKLSQVFSPGNAEIVHTWFFPGAIKLKKFWVQVSGQLTPPDNGNLPNRVTVLARFEDVNTGKVQSRISIPVTIQDDGSFNASKKLTKNVKANSMMTVTIEPTGNALERNTELALCVDVVQKKGDLNTIPSCLESGGDGGGGGAVALSQLQNELFSPTCAVSGCHNAASARAGLVLVAGMTFGETVNVPSSQVPGFDRIEPSDPDNSYLIKKLRGDADVDGDRMPDGGPFLSDEQINRVISWINSGAPNN